MKKILFLFLIAFVLSSSSSIESSKEESPFLAKINSIIETIPNEDIKIICKKIVDNLAAAFPYQLIIELIRIIGCENAKTQCSKIFREDDCNSVINVICA